MLTCLVFAPFVAILTALWTTTFCGGKKVPPSKAEDPKSVPAAAAATAAPAAKSTPKSTTPSVSPAKLTEAAARQSHKKKASAEALKKGQRENEAARRWQPKEKTVKGRDKKQDLEEPMKLLKKAEKNNKDKKEPVKKEVNVEKKEEKKKEEKNDRAKEGAKNDSKAEPKRRVMVLDEKRVKIAMGAKRKNTDYPTMKDIESDWDSVADKRDTNIRTPVMKEQDSEGEMKNESAKDDPFKDSFEENARRMRQSKRRGKTGELEEPLQLRPVIKKNVKKEIKEEKKKDNEKKVGTDVMEESKKSTKEGTTPKKDDTIDPEKKSDKNCESSYGLSMLSQKTQVMEEEEKDTTA